MTQNVYDQPEFFDGYSQLDRSVAGLDGAAEWPSIRAMLPPVRGLKIVDLGCGFGWFCRWASAQGAAQVLGIDMSEKMLGRAAATAPNGGVTYRQGDLARLELPAASFDLAYSSLALHYIDDVAVLFASVLKALVPGGAFVFSTEHPIFMAPASPGWSVDPDGRKTWPVSGYSIQGERTTDWLTKGVVKYHRTIGTTLTLLIRAGFTITHVEEFCPTAEQIAARPELQEERERPTFLLVASRR